MLVQIGQIFVETETGVTSLELSDLFLSGPIRDQVRMLENIKSDADGAYLDAVDEALDEADAKIADLESGVGLVAV